MSVLYTIIEYAAIALMVGVLSMCAIAPWVLEHERNRNHG
jgi:hypothetical protein